MSQLLQANKQTKNEASRRDPIHVGHWCLNPLNAKLNPICHLLALIRAHPILHVSRIRVKLFYITALNPHFCRTQTCLQDSTVEPCGKPDESNPHTSNVLFENCNVILYRRADKSLVRPGRKEARKHVRNTRDFNNIETRAVIKFFFARQGAEGNSRHSDRNISLFPSWSG